MADLNPDRAGDLLAVQFEFDHVFGFDPQALRHRGTDQHGVVPGELVHRLGQFLQPAVVGELSVVDGGIAADVELDGVGVSAGVEREACAVLLADLLRRERRAFDPAVVQRLAPERVEVGAGVLLLPVGLHEVVSGGVGLPGEQRDQF